MLAFRKSKNPEDTQSSVDDFLEHWPRPSISEILQGRLIQTPTVLLFSCLVRDSGSVSLKNNSDNT